MRQGRRFEASPLRMRGEGREGAAKPSGCVGLCSRGDGLHQRNNVFPNGVVRDLPECAHEPEAILEFRHVELFRDGDFDAGITRSGKEICHRDVQYLGNFIEPAATHPVGSLFIFLYLLKRYTELLSKVGLRKRQLQPTQPDTLSNNDIDWMRH